MSDVAKIAANLGAAQKRVVMSLSEKWGKADGHQTARRMFWGIRDGHILVEHKYRTDNCWRLTDLGLAVRQHLQEQRP